MIYSDIDLVKNGKSEYAVVLPDKAQFYEKHAAAELCEYFFLATGIKLPIIAEKEAVFTDSSRYLIIGESRLLQGICFEETKQRLGIQGLKLKRENGNLFLYGGSGAGTLYSVYEFLHWQFGYEVYALEEIELEQNVRNKKLIDFDFEDKPSLPLRQAFVNPKFFFSSINAHKLRTTVFKEIFIRATRQPWHNTLDYFPVEEYKAQHPKWYLDDNRQLHYTAHGDKDELKALQDLLFDKMITFIERDYADGGDGELIGFMQEDENYWANDESVTGYKEKYGEAYAAAMLIHFLNPIARRLKEYMKEKHNGKKMSIVTFAYQKTEEAPVIETDGKYVPIDDSVILEDNLMMFIAPVHSDYENDFYHERNRKAYINIQKWKVLSSNLSFWIYSKYHSNNLMHFDFMDSIPSILKMLKEANAYYMFVEANGNRGNVTFNALREYICAKLMWNVNLDAYELARDFFRHYYKDAAEEMYSFYCDLRQAFATIRKNKELKHNIFDILDKREYWELTVLNDFIERAQNIYKTIEHYKIDNPLLYKVLSDRICGDTMVFRYIKMLNYPEAYSEIERRIEKEKIRYDYERIGITRYLNVKKDLAELWKLWDV